MSSVKNYSINFADCVNLMEMVMRVLDEGRNDFSIYTDENIESVLREYPVLHTNIYTLIPNDSGYDELKEIVSTYLEHALVNYNDLAELINEGVEDYISIQKPFNALISILSMLAVKYDDYGLDFFDFDIEEYMDFSDEYVM